MSGWPAPAPPGAESLSHDESFVLLTEPRQFLGEHGHALAPGAGHFRDVRAPEHPVRTKGIVDLSQIGVHRGKRIGLAGIARCSGRFDRHIGELRQGQKGRHVGHGFGILQRGQATSAAQMIDRQAKSGVALGDPAKFRQRIRCHRGDWNASCFSGRPKPLECAIMQPLPREIAEEPLP
jgi:hypothetical protein